MLSSTQLFSNPLKRFLLFFMLMSMLFIHLGYSQTSSNDGEKPARILFLLDASGSMSQPWSGTESRFQTASRILLDIMDSIHRVNPDVSFGLRAFGEQYPAKDSNCYDTKLEVNFGFDNRDQMEVRLSYLEPMGFSPIALSLQQAAEQDFTNDKRYAYSIILITDGGESCGGDICAVFQQLLNKKISFKPYILTLIDYEPLLKEYDCLGEVLKVASEASIVPAIQRIINDNRQILTVKDETLTNAVKRIPPAPKVTQSQDIVATPAPKPVVAVPPPSQPDPKPQPKKIETPAPTPKTTTETFFRAPVPNIQKLPPTGKLFKPNILFALPSPKLVSIPPDQRVLGLPIVNEPTMTANSSKVNSPVSKNKVVPVKKPGITKVDFFTTTVDAPKTTLQIYFTNGNGKFYYTEPLMDILSSGTGKQVKEVYRNLSGQEPVPIDMEAGTYDIVIPGSESKAENVTIQANKTNKVYIKAGFGSLAFYYSTKPNQPVKEYTAFVSDRFGSRSVTNQPCDTQLSYPPANYHIEINTHPKLVYNIDLNFNQLKLVSIPTPGLFRVLNKAPMGKVQLFRELGNSFESFMDMPINGNPDDQVIDLLPGQYQVRYFKTPRKPYDAPVVIPFHIKSENTTSITLEP